MFEKFESIIDLFSVFELEGCFCDFAIFRNLILCYCIFKDIITYTDLSAKSIF